MFNNLFLNKGTITYKDGETLCKQGAIANQIMIIEEGYAKVYIEHRDKNVIIRINRPGDVVGLHNLYHSDNYAFSVAAITNCQVKIISFDELKEQLSVNLEISQDVINQINMCARACFKRLISITQKQLHGRLADVIIHLAEDIYRSDEFELTLTRKDIAEFTGMSTESTIRIIKEFHNDKIIHLSGKKLKIVSMKLLQKLSDLG